MPPTKRFTRAGGTDDGPSARVSSRTPTPSHTPVSREGLPSTGRTPEPQADPAMPDTTNQATGAEPPDQSPAGPGLPAPTPAASPTVDMSQLLAMMQQQAQATEARERRAAERDEHNLRVQQELMQLLQGIRGARAQGDLPPPRDSVPPPEYASQAVFAPAAGAQADTSGDSTVIALGSPPHLRRRMGHDSGEAPVHGTQPMRDQSAQYAQTPCAAPRRDQSPATDDDHVTGHHVPRSSAARHPDPALPRGEFREDGHAREQTPWESWSTRPTERSPGVGRPPGDLEWMMEAISRATAAATVAATSSAAVPRRGKFARNDAAVPRFKGFEDPHGVRQFVRRVDRFLGADGDYRFGDFEFTDRLTVAFEGQALDWYHSLPSNVVREAKTWEDWKALLIHNFGSSRDTYVRQSAAQDRVWEHPEDVRVYYVDKTTKWYDAFPNASAEDVGNAVLRGLPPRFGALLHYNSTKDALPDLNYELQAREPLLASHGWQANDTYAPASVRNRGLVRRAQTQQSAQSQTQGQQQVTPADNASAGEAVPPYPCRTCGANHFHSQCPERNRLGLNRPRSGPPAATGANATPMAPQWPRPPPTPTGTGPVTSPGQARSTAANLVLLEEVTDDNDPSGAAGRQTSAFSATVEEVVDDDSSAAPVPPAVAATAEEDDDVIRLDAADAGQEFIPTTTDVVADGESYVHRAVVDGGAAPCLVSVEYLQKHLPSYDINPESLWNVSGIGSSQTALGSVVLPLTFTRSTHPVRFRWSFW